MAHSERIKILKLAKQGKLPENIDTESNLDIDIVADLYAEELLQGINASSFDGKAYINLSITQEGLDVLSKQKSSVGYIATHIVAPFIVAIASGLFLYQVLKEPEWELKCSYIPIKTLGWHSGHKINFCKAAGYDKGNLNHGDYKNGGVCIGGDYNLCKASIQSKPLPEKTKCEKDGVITNCYSEI